MSGAARPATRGTRAATSLAFITGCGRSGTTILGEVLAQHPEVRFLNDRIDLWTVAFPIADVWNEAGDGAPARIALGAADANERSAARQRFVESLDAERGGKATLVEKLPINNFRLPFLAALCPGAAHINILRNGIEVAASIERRAATGRWFGDRDRKWRLLAEHARVEGHAALVELCTTPFLRGLLEWRLSVEEASAFFDRFAGRVLRLRYEDLLADPGEVARSVVEFLGLAPSPAVERLAAERIRRLAPAASELRLPAEAEEIAGDTLRRFGYWQ